MSRTLTCYAIGGKDGWEAICVDLDLAVQGRSFYEVYATLNAAIRDYINSASNESPEQAKRLLSRTAPWHVRVRLAGAFLWAWLRGRHNGETAGFLVACEA